MAEDQQKNSRRRARKKSSRRREKEEEVVVVAPAQPQSISARVNSRMPKVYGRSVDRWVDMMINPQVAEVVHSPAPGGGGYSCTVSRFTFVRNISYDDTENGSFSVVATPSVQDPLILMQATLRYPEAGTRALNGYAQCTFDSQGMPDGWLQVSDTALNQKVRVVVPQTVDGVKGWPISQGPGVPWTQAVTNKAEQGFYYKFGYHYTDGSGWHYSDVAFLAAEGSASKESVGGVGQDSYTIVYTDKDGAIQPPSQTIGGLLVTVALTAGFVPASAGPGSVGYFVNDELAEIGQIENCRVTAMSLLISPQGQWANVGGALVMARTLASNIDKSSNIEELQENIEKLNENTWANVTVAKGGYAFWTPDDSASYAPHKYGSTTALDQNVLIACGKMLEGNSLRIVASFVVEFYSPKQVFSKSWSPPLMGDYEIALNALIMMKPVSANEEHESMIARIRATIRRILDATPAALRFVADHSSTILHGAQIAAALL